MGRDIKILLGAGKQYVAAAASVMTDVLGMILRGLLIPASAYAVMTASAIAILELSLHTSTPVLLSPHYLAHCSFQVCHYVFRDREAPYPACTQTYHMLGEALSCLITFVAAYPDRPQEWVDKNSRRIWREDQVKREYWNQQAPAFRQSKNRAWVLKACYWQWQMSSRSDFLPVPHRDTAGKAADSQALSLHWCWS